jgi:putative GTP pyrophosphokinase
MGGAHLDLEALNEEIAVVNAFREAAAPALKNRAALLRYYVRQVVPPGEPIVVTQRLKRFPTIVDKLGREPRMDLARMQDVAGCRAVVPTQDQVDAIVEHLGRQRRWDIAETYDYVREPKSSGYRAVHLVVRKDGHLVEIQLRTKTQQDWAETVETVDRQRAGLGLKFGRAPDDVVEYFSIAGALLAAGDQEIPADPALVRRLQELNAALRNPHREP